uniref:Uracil phosphoribosyltransferase homolog n=1 Tax=Aceria tosichella TaxID=561515 RepID=A0A6G1SBY0_9ACAR
MHISKQNESEDGCDGANTTTNSTHSSNEDNSAETQHLSAGRANLVNNVQNNHNGADTPSAGLHTNHVGAITSPLPPPQSAAIVQVPLASIHSLHPQLDLKLNNRFMLMPLNDQIRELQTVLRDKATSRGDFKFYADRLIRLVVEEGLNQLPIERVEVMTPTGHSYPGIRYLKGNCGVSIVRSGESMEQGLRDCCRSIRIGKILIESDENNQARVLYTKFPRDIEHRRVLVLYPIMSTGLAVVESIKVLLRHGVKEDNMILLNLFSSPRACKMINGLFPRIFVLTSDINPVCPNHFGQRYFGTD